MTGYSFCGEKTIPYPDVDADKVICGTLAVPNSHPPRCRWHGGYPHNPVVALFARADHPEGWGQGKTAHGYVVLAVHCDWWGQVIALADVLQSRGLPEPLGHSWRWFGGNMDFLGGIRLAGDDHSAIEHQSAGGVDAVFGDNRIFLLRRAGPLLREIGQM